MTDTNTDCTFDPLLLDNQVCFLLYSASRAVTAAYRPLLNELQLTYPQYLVMLVLWEHQASVSNKGTTVGQICEKLHLDTGTITPLVKRLESGGLVTRKRLVEDERVVVIQLTEDGERLRMQAQGVPGKLLCQLELGFEELEEVRKLLTDLNHKLLPLLK